MQTVVAARRLARRADRVHRRRAAEHRGDPRARWSTTPSSCSSTSRARSAPSRSTSRCRSATASSPRPPTRSSRCRRCSTTGSAPGRIEVAFLGAAQVDRFANLNSTVIGDYDHPQHAPARRRRRAGDRARLRRGGRGRAALAAHVRRAARLRHDRRLRRRPGRPRAARPARRGPTAVITDLGVLEPDPDARADPDAVPRGRRPSSRRARRPAGSSPSPSRLRVTEPPTDEELAALRELLAR